MTPGSSKPTARSEAAGPARQGAVGGRERILQEIDWEFLAGLNQEETLLLLLSLLERPGLSEETRQTLRTAMSHAIPVPAALSGRARPVLLRLLRRGSDLEPKDLEILFHRLRERRPWSAEDVFDLLEVLPFELWPYRACRLARVLPLLARVDRGRSLAFWRRLITLGSDGVRLACLPTLLRQGEMEDRFVLDLVRHVVADSDVLFRIELAASMPLDAPFSQPAVELLAAQWTGQRQYEPLGSLFDRLAAGPVELQHAAFHAALGCGLLAAAPTPASVREVHAIPVYDLPALEEALEIEGGCYLQVLACLFKVAADPEAGLLLQRVAEELMSERVENGEDSWASWLRDSEVQPHLSALIDAWGSRDPGRARQLVLRLLEVQAFETDPGEALAFRFEKALCRAALELPKETSLLLEFLADPPDWLTGLVGRELAIERVRGVAAPLPTEALREMALGIGAAMKAGPDGRCWRPAKDLLLELAGRVWRDLADAYVEAETTDESERLVRRIDLVAWCGSLPGSFFALLAHIGLRPGCTAVAVIGARLTLAVAHLASCEGTRWPSLPYPLTSELASFVCRQLAKGLRNRPWPEVGPELAYLCVGIEKSRPAWGGGVLVG